MKNKPTKQIIMKPHKAQTIARLILDYNGEAPTGKALTKLTFEVFKNLKQIIMAVSYEEKEIELNGVNYLCEVEIEGRQVEGFFTHEFGIDLTSSVEITGVEIITVYDESDNVVTKRRIISALENLIDADDFEDVEFDFSN